MIEHGATKIAGAKIFGAIISPAFAILALGGIIAWKFWENKQEIKEIRAKGEAHAKTQNNLNTKIEVLSAQKIELLRQLTQIQDKLLGVPPSMPKSNHINQSSKPTTKPTNLSIFKQIIDDNVDLRNAIA